MPNLRLSAIVLILANLVPVIGVLYWGWDVGSVIVLYWFENVIIGVLNIPKLWMANGGKGGGKSLSVFFTFHYGLFTAVHGVFVFELFNVTQGPAILMPGGVLFATALIMTGSHVLSFFINFVGRQEYEGRLPRTQMALPYGRVIVLHVVILGGGILVQEMGSPLAAMLLLIGIKIIIDLIAHLRSHKPPVVTA